MAQSQRVNLSRDLVPQRRKLQVNQLEIMKQGRPPRKQLKRHAGVTVTLSFTGTKEIDELIDRWASRWNVSRSEVCRQALLSQDMVWKAKYRGD